GGHAMNPEEAGRVIIVGAGPVGLGAALELARCGVRSVLIEKHDTTSWHPKTRNFNTRTMEIARGWGPAVYKRLRSNDTPPGWKSPIRFLRTATGEQLGVIEAKGFEGPGPDVSPAWPVMSSQELIEGILLEGVRATGMVDVRFATEARTLVQGGSPTDERAALEVRSDTRTPGCGRSTCSAAPSPCSPGPEATRGAPSPRRPNASSASRSIATASAGRGSVTSAASPKRTDSARTAPCSSDPTGTWPGAAPPDRGSLRCFAPPSRTSSLPSAFGRSARDRALPSG